MLVQNKGNHSYEANGLVLVPGVNEVEEKAFEQFLSHPLMAHLDKKVNLSIKRKIKTYCR